MPTEHVVKQGECLSSIAEAYGFFPETIWDDPDNQELRDLRVDGNSLLPGDILIIMDKRETEVSSDTEARHTFRRKGVPEKLSIAINTWEGGEESPKADAAFTLTLDGRTRTGLTTDGKGMIQEFIPPRTKRASVVFEDGEEFEFELGDMDPITTVSGVQCRLSNLGFECGPPTDVVTVALIAGIREYEQARGLDPVTGAYNDEAFVAKLEEEYEEGGEASGSGELEQGDALIEEEPAPHPVNFRTVSQAVTAPVCQVSHGTAWDSSTGDLEALTGLRMRERVVFDVDLFEHMPGYQAYLQEHHEMVYDVASKTLTKELPAPSPPSGGAVDNHNGAGYGPAIGTIASPNLKPGDWTMTAEQWYEYYDQEEDEWVPLHDDAYEIVREMERTDDGYQLTLSKTGPGINPDLTTGPVDIQFSILDLMPYGSHPTNQFEFWSKPVPPPALAGGIIDQLTRDQFVAVPLGNVTGNGINYSFEKYMMGPGHAFIAIAGDPTGPDVLDAEHNATLDVFNKAIQLLNSRGVLGGMVPPNLTVSIAKNNGQMMAIMMDDAQQNYRLHLRYNKLLGAPGVAELDNDPVDIACREGRRKWSAAAKAATRATAIVVHEFGHMLHSLNCRLPFLYSVILPGYANSDAMTPAEIRPETLRIAEINQRLMDLSAQKYTKTKWNYSRANPSEMIAESFTAMMYKRTVPIGYAAVYIAYGGYRCGFIDGRLRKALGIADGNPIPNLTPEDAVAIMDQGTYPAA